MSDTARAGGRRLPAARPRPRGRCGSWTPRSCRRSSGGNTNAPDDHDRREGRRPDPRAGHERRDQLLPQRQGPPLVLLHGVGPPLAGLGAGDRAAGGRVRRDRLRHARLRALGPAARRDRADDPRLRGRLRVVLRRARASSAPTSPATRWAAAMALELARGRAASSVTAFSPIGFWNARRTALLPLLAGCSSASPRRRCAPVMETARGGELGRRLLFAQLFGYPQRVRPRRRWRRCATPGRRPPCSARCAASRATSSAPPSSCAARP